jgi:large subunit ribosomal protein L22
MYAKLSRIRMSPLKVNIVADLVRGKSVENALTMLRFLPKKAAINFCSSFIYIM